MCATRADTLDLTKTTLAVLFIVTLMAASVWIVRPFLTSFIWAAMIVIATWPALLWLQAHLTKRRGAAVAVMLFLILVVVVAPFLFAVLTIIGNGDDIAQWVRTLADARLPAPPAWVEHIPLAGKSVASKWEHFISLSNEEIATQLAPLTRKATRWFVAQAGGFIVIILQFFLMVIISGALYAKGEAVSGGVRRFARRLAGRHGEEAAVLAAKAIRGVALGVVVTAMIQSVIGGIALAATGIPAVALLMAVMFILCLAQLGPALVMIPAAIWLYSTDGVLWGTFLLVLAIAAQVIDNFIRPVLIKKGVDLSLFLIIPGVIGGLVAFGVVGLFIGPVVLAVTFILLKVWIRQGESDGAPARHPLSSNSCEGGSL